MKRGFDCREPFCFAGGRERDTERDDMMKGTEGCVWARVDYYCLRHLRVAVGMISHSVRKSVLFFSLGEGASYFMVLFDDWN